MARFKVGDEVRVVNNGSRFDIFTTWFEVNREHLKTEWLIKYRYDDSDNITGDVCTVLYCAPHTTCADRMLYLIKDGNYVYLIGEAGIELARRRMTQAEIERTLGYKIEIVEDDEDDE